MKASSIIALASALLLMASPASGGGASRGEPARSFETSGSCTEVLTSVLVDADRARDLVPDGFAVSESAGKARVNIFAEECETAVDDGAPSRSIVGGIGIVLDAARSRGGCQAYTLRWTNSRNDEFARAYQRIGWDMSVVQDSTFSVEELARLGVLADATVPLRRAPFELHAAGTNTAPAADAPLTSVHCHLGPRGLVRGAFRHQFQGVSAVEGEVVFGEGALWEELGLRSQSAPMLLFRFTWTGPTELVPEEDTTDATLEGCTDTFVLVEGDEGAIRAAVPKSYELGGELPVGAQLWSISSSCDAIRVGDGPAREGTIAFLGASVKPPHGMKGPEDIHSYLFWAVTSDRRLQRVLAAGGLPAYHERGTRQTRSRGLVLGHSVLEVPWRGSPYRIAAATTPAATHPHNHDAHWWYEGPDGTREVVVHLAFSSENLADCAVTTAGGSRLAKLLGGTERATPCFLQGPTSSTLEL